MKIIFTNDDYSLTRGFSMGVEDCFKRGLTTSTSVRINGTDFERSVNKLKTTLKRAGIGLHLNITDGPTIGDELADSRGSYKYNFISYLLFYIFGIKKLDKKILREFENQYETLRKKGIRPDHADSQDHIHMIPSIFELTCKFCIKHKITSLRLVNEPYFKSSTIPSFTSVLKFLLLNYFSRINRKIAKKYKLKIPDAFYGLMHTNNMTSKIIRESISDALKRKFEVIEVVSHPAYINQDDICYTSRFIGDYSNLANRVVEMKALLNRGLKSWVVRKKGLEKATFKDLVA